MGKLADALHEKSRLDDALIVGSEIRAALQELSTEVSKLRRQLFQAYLDGGCTDLEASCMTYGEDAVSGKQGLTKSE